MQQCEFDLRRGEEPRVAARRFDHRRRFASLDGGKEQIVAADVAASQYLQSARVRQQVGALLRGRRRARDTPDRRVGEQRQGRLVTGRESGVIGISDVSKPQQRGRRFVRGRQLHRPQLAEIDAHRAAAGDQAGRICTDGTRRDPQEQQDLGRVRPHSVKQPRELVGVPGKTVQIVRALRQALAQGIEIRDALVRSLDQLLARHSRVVSRNEAGGIVGHDGELHLGLHSSSNCLADTRRGGSTSEQGDPSTKKAPEGGFLPALIVAKPFRRIPC